MLLQDVYTNRIERVIGYFVIEKMLSIIFIVIIFIAAGYMEQKALAMLAIALPLVSIHEVYLKYIVESASIFVARKTKKIDESEIGLFYSVGIFCASVSLTYYLTLGCVFVFLGRLIVGSVDVSKDVAAFLYVLSVYGVCQSFIMSTRLLFQTSSHLKYSIILTAVDLIVGTAVLLISFLFTSKASPPIVLSGAMTIGSIASVLVSLYIVVIYLHWRVRASFTLFEETVVVIAEGTRAAIPAIVYFVVITYFTTLLAKIDADILVARAYLLAVMRILAPWPWAVADWLRLNSARAILRKRHHLVLALFNKSLRWAGFSGCLMALVAAWQCLYALFVGNLDHSEAYLVETMVWGIGLEFARTFNVQLLAALRAIGDVKYPARLSTATIVVVTGCGGFGIINLLDGGLSAAMLILLFEEILRYLLLRRRLNFILAQRLIVIQ